MYPSSIVLVIQGLSFAIWSSYFQRSHLACLGLILSVGIPGIVHPILYAKVKSYTGSYPSAKLTYTIWSLIKHVVNSALLWTCTWPSFGTTLGEDGVPIIDQWSRTDGLSSQHQRLEAVYVFILVQWFVDYVAYLNACVEYTPKDFLVMRWHHVITVGLMIISFWLGYLPIGCEILYFHELTDIVVSSLQLQKTLKMDFLVPTFLVTIGTWAYFRVWSFGWLIFSLLSSLDSSSYFVLLAEFCLVGLWSMHVYWLGLMVSIAAKLTTTSPSKLASEYDGNKRVEN